MIFLAIALSAIPQYFIAIKKNEGDVLNTLTNYLPFVPPEGKFYADPFLFKYQGVNYLFFEDCDGKKGVISCAAFRPDGVLAEPQLALELPIHLSFPYIFEDQGEIYMVPETYRYRSIALYKCVAFPHRWERQRILVQGEHFSDPILFKYKGFYWLFTSINKDQMMIYYAQSLNARFLPHPINRRRLVGRNAGPVFSVGDRLIRPTMDCSERYGRSMIFKEILLLTEREFIEQEVFRIEPNWAPDLEGTHTYGQNEDYVVYDGEKTFKGKSGK